MIWLAALKRRKVPLRVEMTDTTEKKKQQALDAADRVCDIQDERSRFKRMILDIMLEDTSASTLIQWLLNTMPLEEQYDLICKLHTFCTIRYFSSDERRPIG